MKIIMKTLIFLVMVSLLAVGCDDASTPAATKADVSPEAAETIAKDAFL